MNDFVLVIVIGSVIALIVLRFYIFIITDEELQKFEFEIARGSTVNKDGEALSLDRLIQDRKYMQQSEHINYYGTVIVPKRVYVLGSKKINIHFIAVISSPIRSKEYREKKLEEEDGQLTVEIVPNGFVLKESAIQQQPYSKQRMEFEWNCFFPDAGEFAPLINLRFFEDSLEIPPLQYKFHVEVVKIRNFSREQLSTLEVLTMFLAVGLIFVALFLYMSN